VYSLPQRGPFAALNNMSRFFCIIGAGKCGTTRLWSLLDQHPDIHMCPDKEPNFFNKDRNYKKGLAHYMDLFGQHDAAWFGEASNNYSCQAVYPETAGRLHKHFPEARLIYIVRNPLQRMESDYMESCRNDSGKKMSFAAFVMEDPWAREKSLFHKQLQHYLNYFDKSRILLLFFEDLKEDEEAVTRQILEFLDLPGQIPQTAVQDSSSFRSSSSYQADTPFLGMFRRMGLMPLLRKLVPAGLKAGLLSLLKKEASVDRPVWEENFRQQFIQYIRSDSQAILAAGGKPPRFWDLES
jgi:hypothetical protein